MDPLTEPEARSATEPRDAGRAPLIGLCVTIVLIVLAVAVPPLAGWIVYGDGFPPLHGTWDPRVGPGTPAAILIAVLTVLYSPRVTQWGWRRLLAAVFVGGLGWMLSLATVDGLDGLGRVLDGRYEYLQTARGVSDIGALLREFVSRIPFSAAPDNWPVHVAGHPPGALLFFVALARLGLGGWLAAGLVIIVLAATTAVAVMITLRRLGAESLARSAAPFLVITPAAIWMAVSADAMFAAVAAWGLCTLAVAATSRGTARVALWSALAGLLLGSCVLLSYGLPVLGVLAITVLARARSWVPLLWAVAAALGVVAAFAVGGFAWWEAFPVLVHRYWAGDARLRPGGYWVWGNLAAVAICAGPLVGAGIAMAGREVVGERRRIPGDDARARRTVAALALAACASIALADLSQMSRGEVERIWLPFVPWLLVGLGLLPRRWHRAGLIGTAAFAIIVQHLLFTGW